MLLKWPKEPAGDRGRLCQEWDPGKAGSSLWNKGIFPSVTWKLQWRKGSKSCSSPTSFSLFHHPVHADFWFFPASFLFFLFYLVESFPSRLYFHRKTWILCGTAILGSFLERSRSPQIFFGLDPLPKAIKAHKELSAQICFSTAKLGFSPQGEQGGREAIKLQVFSAHSWIFNSNPSLQMSKVQVFGRHKIGQPEPTKVLLFTHSSRNFPEQAFPKHANQNKKFQMPALHHHLQLRFCISKIKIKREKKKQKKVNIAHLKSCWRRNFLLHLLMSKMWSIFCLWQEPTGRQVTPWAHSLLLHLKKEYFFFFFSHFSPGQVNNAQEKCSTHLSQVSHQEHTKSGCGFFFFCISMSGYRKGTALQEKESPGCCGF